MVDCYATQRCANMSQLYGSQGKLAELEGKAARVQHVVSAAACM